MRPFDFSGETSAARFISRVTLCRASGTINYLHEVMSGLFNARVVLSKLVPLIPLPFSSYILVFTQWAMAQGKGGR